MKKIMILGAGIYQVPLIKKAKEYVRRESEKLGRPLFAHITTFIRDLNLQIKYIILILLTLRVCLKWQKKRRLMEL